MQICLECGKETKNKKFCSIECRSKYITKHSKKQVSCEICGKIFEVYKKSTKRFCSNECRKVNMQTDKYKAKMKESYRKTMQKKYGVDHFFKTKEFQIIAKKTKKERYNDENYNNIDKIKETKKEKYNDENYNNSNKNKITKKERYDDENYNNRDKFKKTMNEQYDGIGLQRDSVLKASQKGLIKKYGVNTSLKNKEVRNKITDTIQRKYKNKTYWGSDVQISKRHDKKLLNIIPILNELNIILLSEYNGTKYTNNNISHYKMYNFKCKKCNTNYISHFANGNIPLCPTCNYIPYTKSKIEDELFLYLNSLNINDVIERNKKTILNKKELDFYFPKLKIAIELNGNYWHSELSGNKSKNYHLNKTIECENLGIQLIHIFEDEWMFKKEIVKNRLKHILNINNNSIYARNCIIKEIDIKSKNNFLNTYHLQGADKSKIKLGIFNLNELIGVMTFGKPRIALGYKNNENNTYELIRFVTNKRIIGGASKLLSYFTKNHKPNKIITYADRRWSKGNLYEKIGFKKVSDGVPNYWYINKKNYLTRFYRFNFRKNVLNEKLDKFNQNLTEWENMQLNDYDRIWDCGSLKYEMIL